MQEETNRNFAIDNLETKAGKGLGIYKVSNTSLYRVAFTTGGQLPSELDGMWTDPVMAQKTVKAYLSKKENERIAAETKAIEDAEIKAKQEAANRAKNVPEVKKAPASKSVPKNTKKA